ncbi:hypothetical protein EC844_13110 [Acinetobacter calcoaceticus]|uniref:Uncharacterized protein n=1 Tax=Acinetobacter calcoaceticus TaxID=471 RepID=A0A4R1XCZ4_ACICA|nr:hypothetical protein EC844_13110 [Acinetobacter calcoaceticus]
MKKLKYQYRQSIRITHKAYFGLIYPNIKSLYHKKFSTQQERGFYFLHVIEYKGYPLKIRAARGKGLAQVWDDLPASVYSVAKSWKHNSKRKHQYYKQHEQKYEIGS